MTNESLLRQTLQRHLDASDASKQIKVDACRIDQVRHKPGGALQLRFTAAIRGRNAVHPYQQPYIGWPLKRENGHTRLNPENIEQPRFGPAVIEVPEWGMMFWAYPNDPRLPGLALMANNEKVLELAREAPQNFGLADPPYAVAAELKKYVPGMRCGFAYKIKMSSPSSNGEEHPVRALFGKAYHRGRGENAYAIMKAIWESEACQRGDVVLPRPYSYDVENQILWQEALFGQPFSKIASSMKNLPEVAKEIGRRLAAYHGIPLELPQKMTLESEVGELKKAITAIKETFPRYAKQCDVVGHKLLSAALRLEDGPLSLIHASFKFSHIVSTDKGIAFIDFDGANLGDPGYDLGRFIAHLCKMQAGWKIHPEVADETIGNFCDSYNRAALVPVMQDRIDWFAACHLVSSQVYKAVKRMKPDLVSKLLKRAGQFCPA